MSHIINNEIIKGNSKGAALQKKMKTVLDYGKTFFSALGLPFFKRRWMRFLRENF